VAIETVSSDNDDYVRFTEFFYDHHFIGRSTGNRVTWENVPNGNFKLIAVAVDNRGRRSIPDTIRVRVAKSSFAPEGSAAIPLRFSVSQNYPNPFNPDTVIRYQVQEKSRVEITVYDAAGNTVRRLLDRVRSPGGYSVRWDGLDGQGRSAGSGVYFCRIRATWQGREHTATRKMVLAR
jgi:hypothetical protein